MKLTHGSLYTGIGMWLLAAWKAKIKNNFTCEIDDYCNQILDKRFPNTDRLYDIKETDFTRYQGEIDILSSSDPCQPHSFSGSRKGAHDSRFLWSQTLRAIQEIRPTFVVLENVYGFISLAFDVVVADLESEGYQIESFVIPACAVGSPHRRERVWILAYSWDTGRHQRFEEISTENGEVRQSNQGTKLSNAGFYDANTILPGLEGCRSQGRQQETQPQNGTEFIRTESPGGVWDKWWATESGLGGMVDGYTRWLDEPVPRLTTIRDDRTKRIKAVGNAIVPQIAYIIFESIKQVYTTKSQ